MKSILYFLIIAVGCAACACNNPDPDNPPIDDILPGGYTNVSIKSTVDAVQPSTGLVLWSDNARSRNSKYGESISLEYAYCLPCKVVKGKVDGKLQYDWSSFDSWLNDVASRNHQAVVRFRYEYPGSRDVDGKSGTTAVPDYIKAMEDYNETYNKNEDGATYYADWSNAELQWFTKQFYYDFNEVYKKDPRIAFLEVGFGHWGEYHIYGTPLKLGINFPSHDYQKEFLTYIDGFLEIPWLISIDAADSNYTPIARDEQLMALTFGLFDDSFMHKEHETGYNEECWNALGKGIRWQRGACGGEISYYTSADQRNFLNPDGMYGVTLEEAAGKYHITFMIANDAPAGKYGTAERFKQASIFCGYNFALTYLAVKGDETVARITNTGVAPIYRDAYLTVGGERSKTSLKGLLPGDEITMSFGRATDGTDVTIESDYILPTQKIQFDADL
ncbi:MAG: DUF4832 domain-containing protein [Bacteroidales bacterium]|nr:DUF4832 domain-containing protein [Bacteroidales bacterium]